MREVGIQVIPKNLLELMSHENIGTTLRFYVGQNAQKTADRAWATYEAVQARQQAGEKTGPANTFVNNQSSEPPKDDARNDTSPCNARACEVGATRFELATF